MINEPTICTIIAKNYISFARTLCASFLEHHPAGKCFVLVIDETESYIDSSLEPFVMLSPQVLPITDWDDFSFKYNITELATAVKPYLLEYILQKKGVDRVLYLDPDILVLNPLIGLYDLLDEGDMVITPHLDKDYPDDTSMPNDSHIMKSGIYNLGFLGVKDSINGLDFLRWWQHKLYDRCVMNHAKGYFVDQKFIDYALPLFDGFKIVSDPGYNVAYWNLHSRGVENVGSEWTCNGGPLYFFHFSDFKAERPDHISRHQNRYQMDELPDLHKLFKHYSSLLQKNDYSGTHRLPYTYSRYRNGGKILPWVRRFYREFRTKVLVDPFGKSNFNIIFHVSPAVMRFAIKKRSILVDRLLRFFG